MQPFLTQIWICEESDILPENWRLPDKIGGPRMAAERFFGQTGAAGPFFG